MPAQWDGVLNASALGILAFVLWYLLTKFVPGVFDSFKEEMKAQRESHEKSVSKIVDAQEKTADAVTHELKVLAAKVTGVGDLVVRHDATVRGVNPKTTGDHQEMRRMWEESKGNK